MSLSSTSNKVAIVTGASSGIGRACGFRFAREGFSVALVARRADEIRAAAREIELQGGRAAVFPGDLTKDSDIERIVTGVVETFGGIDVLVNAAGIISNGTIQNTTLEDWDRLMNLNLRAPFYMMKCAVPYLIERKGAVVNVSSVNGRRAFPNVLAYCVSKAGVDHLTRCAALELAGQGVRVNAVNPGVVRTQLHRSSGMSEEAYGQFLERSKTTHPLGRVGNPDEVAELIFFLASDKAGWITGETVLIDGGRGQTCAR